MDDHLVREGHLTLEEDPGRLLTPEGPAGEGQAVGVDDIIGLARRDEEGAALALLDKSSGKLIPQKERPLATSMLRRLIGNWTAPCGSATGGR